MQKPLMVRRRGAPDFELETSMLISPLPNQFAENEAWIAFKLNTSPILTERDGDFHCFALMDAASGYLLGTAFVSVLAASIPADAAAELMEAAHGHNNEWPKVLIVPIEQELGALIEMAERWKIAIRRFPEAQLNAFVGEAKKGFHERFGHGTPTAS